MLTPLIVRRVSPHVLSNAVDRTRVVHVTRANGVNNVNVVVLCNAIVLNLYVTNVILLVAGHGD